MKKRIAMIIYSLIILSGCGDTTYNMENGNVTNTDNSKESKGHVVTEVSPVVTVENNKKLLGEETLLHDEEEYQKLQNENKYLKEENDNLQKQIDDLNIKQNNTPIIEYKDLGLSINGEDISINKSNSMVTINGMEYVSKEIMDKLISEDQNITITDDTIFIGKVIADKEKLSDQYIMDSLRCQIEDNATDSYGDLHNDCIVLSSGLYGSSEIQFNVNNNFNMLMGTLFVYEGASKGDSTVVTIKADDEVIYTTNLESDTVPIPIDLPINNCSTITISKNGDDYFACVLSNAILYN